MSKIELNPQEDSFILVQFKKGLHTFTGAHVSTMDLALAHAVLGQKLNQELLAPYDNKGVLDSEDDLQQAFETMFGEHNHKSHRQDMMRELDSIMQGMMHNPGNESNLTSMEEFLKRTKDKIQKEIDDGKRNSKRKNIPLSSEEKKEDSPQSNKSEEEQSDDGGIQDSPQDS